LKIRFQADADIDPDIRKGLRKPARVASRGNPASQPTMNAAVVDTEVVSMLFKGARQQAASWPANL
jgi:hypothetical protein